MSRPDAPENRRANSVSEAANRPQPYPVAWQFSDDLHAARIERTVSPFYAGERFAVRQGGFCLNTSGEWEDEPQPSSRDDAFYERCRFKTLPQAVAALQSVLSPHTKETL